MVKMIKKTGILWVFVMSICIGIVSIVSAESRYGLDEDCKYIEPYISSSQAAAIKSGVVDSLVVNDPHTGDVIISWDGESGITTLYSDGNADKSCRAKGDDTNDDTWMNAQEQMPNGWSYSCSYILGEDGELQAQEYAISDEHHRPLGTILVTTCLEGPALPFISPMKMQAVAEKIFGKVKGISDEVSPMVYLNKNFGIMDEYNGYMEYTYRVDVETVNLSARLIEQGPQAVAEYLQDIFGDLDEEDLDGDGVLETEGIFSMIDENKDGCITQAELLKNPYGTLLWYNRSTTNGDEYMITSLPKGGFKALTTDEEIIAHGKLFSSKDSGFNFELTFKDYSDAFLAGCGIIVETARASGVVTGDDSAVTIKFTTTKMFNTLGGIYGPANWQNKIGPNIIAITRFTDSYTDNSGKNGKERNEAETGYGWISDALGAAVNKGVQEDFITWIDSQVNAAADTGKLTKATNSFIFQDGDTSYKLYVELAVVDNSDGSTGIQLSTKCMELDNEGNEAAVQKAGAGVTITPDFAAGSVYDIAKWQSLFSDSRIKLAQKLAVAFQPVSITFHGVSIDTTMGLYKLDNSKDRTISAVYDNLCGPDAADLAAGSGVVKGIDGSSNSRNSGVSSNISMWQDDITITEKDYVAPYTNAQTNMLYDDGYFSGCAVKTVGSGVTRVSYDSKTHALTYYDFSGETYRAYGIEDGGFEAASVWGKLANGYFYVYQPTISIGGKTTTPGYTIQNEDRNNIFIITVEDIDAPKFVTEKSFSSIKGINTAALMAALESAGYIDNSGEIQPLPKKASEMNLSDSVFTDSGPSAEDKQARKQTIYDILQGVSKAPIYADFILDEGMLNTIVDMMTAGIRGCGDASPEIYLSKDDNGKLTIVEQNSGKYRVTPFMGYVPVTVLEQEPEVINQYLDDLLGEDVLLFYTFTARTVKTKLCDLESVTVYGPGNLETYVENVDYLLIGLPTGGWEEFLSYTPGSGDFNQYAKPLYSTNSDGVQSLNVTTADWIAADTVFGQLLKELGYDARLELINPDNGAAIPLSYVSDVDRARILDADGNCQSSIYQSIICDKIVNDLGIKDVYGAIYKGIDWKAYAYAEHYDWSGGNDPGDHMHEWFISGEEDLSANIIGGMTPQDKKEFALFLNDAVLAAKAEEKQDYFMTDTNGDGSLEKFYFVTDVPTKTFYGEWGGENPVLQMNDKTAKDFFVTSGSTQYKLQVLLGVSEDEDGKKTLNVYTRCVEVVEDKDGNKIEKVRTVNIPNFPYSAEAATSQFSLAGSGISIDDWDELFNGENQAASIPTDTSMVDSAAMLAKSHFQIGKAGISYNNSRYDIRLAPKKGANDILADIIEFTSASVSGTASSTLSTPLTDVLTPSSDGNSRLSPGTNTLPVAPASESIITSLSFGNTVAALTVTFPPFTDAEGVELTYSYRVVDVNNPSANPSWWTVPSGSTTFTVNLAPDKEYEVWIKAEEKDNPQMFQVVTKQICTQQAPVVMSCSFEPKPYVASYSLELGKDSNSSGQATPSNITGFNISLQPADSSVYYKYAVYTDPNISAEDKQWITLPDSADTIINVDVSKEAAIEGDPYYVEIVAVNKENQGVSSPVVYPVDITYPQFSGNFSYSVQGETVIISNWKVATDAESGIADYQYCVIAMPNDGTARAWTSLHSVSDAGDITMITGLKPNTTYGIFLSASNGAGLVNIGASQKVTTEGGGEIIEDEGDNEEGSGGISMLFDKAKRWWDNLRD